MTLTPYSPDRLDQLALRFFDLASQVRAWAHTCREAGLDDWTLHDKKALEQLAQLDAWAHKSQADLEWCLISVRAQRDASAQLARQQKKSRAKR